MLDQNITYLKGVGPAKAEVLQSELGIRTWEGLLMHFPFRYIDKSELVTIRQIQTDEFPVQLLLECVGWQEVGVARAKRLVARFKDASGEMELVWFKGISWVQRMLQRGQFYLVYGKPTLFSGKYNMAHPEMEMVEKSRWMSGNTFKPVYRTTEKLSKKGLNSNGIAQLTRQLIAELPVGSIKENLPSEVLKKFQLMDRESAIRSIHLPTSAEILTAARRRLKFEELFFIQIQIARQKISLTKEERGVVFEKVGDYFNDFYHHHLPFELTGAQKRVIKEIRQDVAKGYHMNRLIQGDVGSGKTIVAVLSMLLAVDNGFQSCLMAPTEILAQQHFQLIKSLLSKLSIGVELLTGSTKAKERRRILEGLQDGSIRLLIGTHALIEPVVVFKELGLVIIDEQHRFGVAQRARLWQKAQMPPHILVMTATPIPRTLAMTLYGDLDISVIDELPPGRKPIQTIWRSDARRLEVFQFMEDEIKKGRQIYVVFPLIEESEALDYKDLQDGYDGLSRRFPRPQFQISIVHGRIKNEDRDFEMDLFVKGSTHIMVATTVIEVGVNVPNASVMVIESAERFGLSQLHQLRGRVGRGADQSYCILMTGNKLSAESKTRMETMVRTNNGFEIAEVDLELRGPGDLAGTMQSGTLQLKIADLVKDQAILLAARETALEIVEKDVTLLSPPYQMIHQHLLWLNRDQSDWSRIS
jgi:ATP-dependent DNA helicase RecG